MIILCFVTMHLMGHTVLLVSVSDAQRISGILLAPWHTLAGEILLYGSFIFHALYALTMLYVRRSLAMSAWETLQLTTGLLIPYLMADHIFAAGVGRMIYGWNTTYRGVLSSMWVDAPSLGIQQCIGLVIVWMHGCIGLGRELRRHPSMRVFLIPALLFAVVLPTLALAGFALVGRAMALDGFGDNTIRGAVPASMRSDRHQFIVTTMAQMVRNGYVMLLVAILVARQLRSVWQRATGVDIRYETGAVVHVPVGTSVLEASRQNGIAQYAVCGGNGRCSTCRVRILAADGILPEPNAAEDATLRRIGASPDIRLACQLRPRVGVTVARVLAPPAQAGFQPETPPEERSLAVLFCDLRGFTSYSERHLPYDVVFLLNRYFAAVGQVVDDAGGRIDKFIGDGAMAVFDGDGDLDAGCRSALRAAVGILQAVRELGEQMESMGEEPMRAVVGVHAGPAIVGLLGVPGATAKTAVGDTINVASRLETVAKQEDTSIAVSADVVLRSGVDLHGLKSREISIRGRQSHLQVYLIDDDMARLLFPEDGAEG